MKMKSMTCVLVLLVASCGDAKPLRVTGSVLGEGKSFKAGWGMAIWNEEKKELVVGFLESEPMAEVMEKMKGYKSVVGGGVALSVPIVEVTVKLEEKEGTPSPSYYRMVFHNFGDKGPMTLNLNADFGERVVEVSGNIKSGGNVKGRFQGKDRFEIGEDIRAYSWNLEFDLPVH